MKKENESGYVLKKKYEGIQIGLSGVTVNNKNITEKMAKDLLKVHAPEKIFEKWPDKDASNTNAGEDEAAKAEQLRKETMTNLQFAIADKFHVDKAKKAEILKFAEDHKIGFSAEGLTVPDLVKEVKAWLTLDTVTVAKLGVIKDPEDEAAKAEQLRKETMTNLQFAIADKFDLALATKEQKVEFIEKYEIPYDEKPSGEKFTESEIDKLIENWLTLDTVQQ